LVNASSKILIARQVLQQPFLRKVQQKLGLSVVSQKPSFLGHEIGETRFRMRTISIIPSTGMLLIDTAARAP
jgi:hypothetical protein